MTRMDGVSPLIKPAPILQPSWKEFTITVDRGINLTSIYACIHKIGQSEDGIETEITTLASTGRSISISLDISKISRENGFQIYGFQLSSSGENELVVGLTGNSTYLRGVTSLHLGTASGSTFPTAST